MRCSGCDGLIEESDVPFCPFCGMQIRTSNTDKPIQRINMATDPSVFLPAFDTPSSTGMASYTSVRHRTSALPISTQL